MALPTAFIFTLLVPGLIAHKFFRLQTHEKWAFIPLFSILVSTQLVYYLSMLAGYSKETILASFLALTAVYTLVTFKKGEPLPLKTLPKIKKTNKTVLLVLLVIFALSLAVLLRSVWYTNQYPTSFCCTAPTATSRRRCPTSQANP